MRLEDKVSIITGGGGGMGRVAAQMFAALGCTDKAGCAAQMIETPELGWGIKARGILWLGYGL